MKLLLISVDFLPHRDGVSSLSYHYARRLAERGHDVLVVGPRSDGDHDVDDGAPFRAMRFPGYSLGLFRFFPFIAWSFAAFLRQKPDLVFPMNIGYGGILCFLLSFVARCRYVTMAYAYEFLKFRSNRLLYKLYLGVYRRSDFTVAVSRFTRDQLVDFGVDADGIRVLYPGVQHDAADEGDDRGGAESFAGDGPTIGTCGRLIRRKGHDLVVRALPELVKSFPGIRYLVTGAGPTRDKLEELARELGVEEHVNFLGPVPREEIGRFYKSLDVFVLAARQDEETGHVEGFGIVFLEAAARGVPSIGTRTGGIPEAVLDGETGMLVPPESSGAIAEAANSLFSDRELLARLGEAARERATGELSWDRLVDSLYDWLEKTGTGDAEGREQHA